MNKQLLLSQCASAIATLRVGGHFVVKCFDLFTPFSAGLLYLLHTAFDAVCLYKPAQSRPANSERYIVCKGMRAGTEALTEHLLYINTRLEELKPDWPCGGRKGAAGRGSGDGGHGNIDVLRLVPKDVLLDTNSPFGEYVLQPRLLAPSPLPPPSPPVTGPSPRPLSPRPPSSARLASCLLHPLVHPPSTATSRSRTTGWARCRRARSSGSLRTCVRRALASATTRPRATTA